MFKMTCRFESVSNWHKWAAIAPALAAVIFTGDGEAATLLNNGDSWVRESAPNNSYSGDLISAWNTSSTDGARRYGVVSFDLTSLAEPVTAVSLSLWSQVNGFSDDAYPLVQVARAIDPTGIDADAATWNQVTTAATLHDFGGFGAYEIGPVASTLEIQSVFLESVGTAADVAFIEGVRTGSGTLMLLLIADERVDRLEKTWGDGEYDGQDAFLSTNADVIPEPASIALVGMGCLVLLRRRR